MTWTAEAKRSAAILAVVALLLVLGGWLRLIAIEETNVISPIRADAADYYLSAYNLVHHDTYSLSEAKARNPRAPMAPDGYRYPGLPLMIALFMDKWPNHMAIVASMQRINLAAGVVAILLIYLAASVALSPKVALVSAGLVAISPHLVAVSVYMLTEPVVLTVLAAVLAWAALFHDRRKWPYFLVLGALAAAAAMLRPINLALPVLLIGLVAISLPKGRRLVASGAVLAGFLLVVSPWFVRNAVNVTPDPARPSLLASGILDGGYPGYMLNGNPATFPYPFLADPRYAKARGSLGSAMDEMARRFNADPGAMVTWYLGAKITYLWGFSNLDGIGDVFIYPHQSTPFDHRPLHQATREVMRWLHWPLVILGLIGAVLVWVPKLAVKFSPGGLFALRAAGLSLLLVTGVHMIMYAATRYSLPYFPALFLLVPVGPWLAWQRLRKTA